MTSRLMAFGIIISALLIALMPLASAQSDLDVSEIMKAQKAFNPEGFKSFGQYSWDNPLCDPNDLYDHSVGRCVGQYQDDRLSIYPVKDAQPDGDYGHAIIHGRVNFTKKDIEYGEKHKWIGSTKYGEVYTLEAGYIFLPRSSFPPHILFSKECRSIRVKLLNETAEIVEEVIGAFKSTGEIIVEYPLGYDHWHSRDPYVIESMCYVESRSYKGKYQPYLGPLKLQVSSLVEGTEWKMDASGEFITLSLAGLITPRFSFKKDNCDRVIHTFSTWTWEPANFKPLIGKVLTIEFNGEKIGAELTDAFRKEPLIGQILFFNLGGYGKDVLLNHLKKNKSITINFLDGDGYKVSDYFDVPSNEWSTMGISEVFEKAYRACSQ